MFWQDVKQNSPWRLSGLYGQAIRWASGLEKVSPGSVTCQKLLPRLSSFSIADGGSVLLPHSKDTLLLLIRASRQFYLTVVFLRAVFSRKLP